jgi:hypothetical protein
MAKTEPHIVEPQQNPNSEAEFKAVTEPQAELEQLDDEEKEFRALRRDLPGVKGASAAGIVTISVGRLRRMSFSGRTRNSDRSSRSWILRLVWSDNFSR